MSIGDTLSAIHQKLTVANATWYTDSAPYQNTLAELRKIAALCVMAGEKYGMPTRLYSI